MLRLLIELKLMIGSLEEEGRFTVQHLSAFREESLKNGMRNVAQSVSRDSRQQIEVWGGKLIVRSLTEKCAGYNSCVQSTTRDPVRSQQWARPISKGLPRDHAAPSAVHRKGEACWLFSGQAMRQIWGHTGITAVAESGVLHQPGDRHTQGLDPVMLSKQKSKVLSSIC